MSTNRNDSNSSKNGGEISVKATEREFSSRRSGEGAALLPLLDDALPSGAGRIPPDEPLEGEMSGAELDIDDVHRRLRSMRRIVPVELRLGDRSEDVRAGAKMRAIEYERNQANLKALSEWGDEDDASVPQLSEEARAHVDSCISLLQRAFPKHSFLSSAHSAPFSQDEAIALIQNICPSAETGDKKVLVHVLCWEIVDDRMLTRALARVLESGSFSRNDQEAQIDLSSSTVQVDEDLEVVIIAQMGSTPVHEVPALENEEATDMIDGNEPAQWDEHPDLFTDLNTTFDHGALRQDEETDPDEGFVVFPGGGRMSELKEIVRSDESLRTKSVKQEPLKKKKASEARVVPWHQRRVAWVFMILFGMLITVSITVAVWQVEHEYYGHLSAGVDSRLTQGERRLDAVVETVMDHEEFIRSERIAKDTRIVQLEDVAYDSRGKSLLLKSEVDALAVNLSQTEKDRRAAEGREAGLRLQLSSLTRERDQARTQVDDYTRVIEQTITDGLKSGFCQNAGQNVGTSGTKFFFDCGYARSMAHYECSGFSRTTGPSGCKVMK